MECLKVEFLPKFPYRQRSQLPDLQHTQHVCVRLSGPGDIAIDLVLYIAGFWVIRHPQIA